VSYEKNPLKYEAVQLGSGSGAQATFIATVDPDSVYTWDMNADGTVTFHNPAGGPQVIAVDDYVVSPGYYGDFPGWNGTWTYPPLDSADLALQYSAI
jgi:hypothetical protein